MRKDNVYNLPERSRAAVIAALLCLLMLAGCSDSVDTQSVTPDGVNMCGVTLKLNVDSYNSADGTSTRSSVYSNSVERTINNIWVFQYDADTGGYLLDAPKYLSGDDLDADDINIDLTDNTGTGTSLVCVVANVGETDDDGNQWALDSTTGKIKDAFSTYEGLIAQAIPTSATAPFLSSAISSEGKAIPMFGVSDPTAVSSLCYINVPLEHMFAKVKVGFDTANLNEMYMSITSVTFNNIPGYTRVSTLATDDLTQAADYTSVTSWQTLTATNVGELVTAYVPENLQGTVSGMSSKAEAMSSDFPENAFYVEINATDTSTGDSNTYKVYPGLDTTNDFNIKRNYIYDVEITFTDN